MNHRLSFRVLFFLILFSSLFGFADPKLLKCAFPGKTEFTNFDSCAFRNQDGSIGIEKSVFKKIDFDKSGLAGGSIGNDGCFWLNKKGLLRKTFCYDNGADYFQEGLARYVGPDGLFGYINKKLKIVIPAKYSFGFPFSKGNARVCQGCKEEKTTDSEHTSLAGGQWMILNIKGEIVKTCLDAKRYDDCDK